MFNFLIVLATFLGPITAVQSQKWIERAKERRERQLQIFRILMATRAIRANVEDHVRALNSIEFTFDGKGKLEKLIREKWNEYLDALNDYPTGDDSARSEAWNVRCVDLLAELLRAIGHRLGYDFTIVQLKRGAYFPRGYHEDLGARFALRRILTGLAEGKWNLPLDIKGFPIDPEAFETQMKVQKAILAALEGRGSLSVAMDRTAAEEAKQD